MEKLIISLLGNWKTSVVAFLAALIIILTQLKLLFDGDPATVMDGTKLLEALAVLGIGGFAKDGDKSSDELGLNK